MEGGSTYNAAADLIERNLGAGRAAKTAFIDERGRYSYAELAERVSRFANLVHRLGVHPEQRILLCLHDTIDFPTVFLGAIKAGVVPVAVNTQLSAGEFAFMLADSRARAVVVSAPLLPAMNAALAQLPEPRPTAIVSGAEPQEGSLAALLAASPATFETATTHPDEPCFWLYSSGSTEMLHIFLSNRPEEVRYGTTGKPIPGYPIKIVDEEGRPVRRGEVGDLLVSGPTSAALYWNNRERSRSTFNGIWTRTGDKYFEDEDGYYVYCGRSDDMLKVSGMYVSPAEVEAALIAHEDVFEAAVVGAPDADGLIRPKAFVVVKPGTRADGDLALALEHHAKAMLPPFKCPRWIAFLDELPKTATGKIQRFKLREVRPG